MSSSKRSHHRYLPIPRLTGLRRHSQSAVIDHGTAQLVSAPHADQSLNHPAHYHSYNPPPAHSTMPQPRQSQQPNPRVRFAGDSEPPHHHHHHNHHNRTYSSSTASASGNSQAHTHSNPVSTASSRTSFDLEPTSQVAEWCHQMHMIQQRRYDWCQACYPRAASVPTADAATDDEVTMAQIEMRRAQMLERVRREREAAHAYQ